MKVHEKWEKIHILGTFWRLVTVHFEPVPVHFVFWSFFANVYRYTLGVYRYTLGVYRHTLLCFSCSDPFSYFGHNLLISYPI